jgi:hypothetical protein
MKQLDLIDDEGGREGELARALHDLMLAMSAARITIRLGSPLDKAWRKAIKALGSFPEERDRFATEKGPKES